MIDAEAALEVAGKKLLEIEREVGEGLALQPDQTLERDFGWIFFYNTEAYVANGYRSDMLAGNAPFIVGRTSGAVVMLGTALPLERYLDEIDVSVP